MLGSPYELPFDHGSWISQVSLAVRCREEEGSAEEPSNWDTTQGKYLSHSHTLKVYENLTLDRLNAQKHNV